MVEVPHVPKMFIYWSILPTEIQEKIFLRVNVFDLMRCRWACKSMANIIFNREFQSKHCDIHGQAPNRFLFNQYLSRQHRIFINVDARPHTAQWPKTYHWIPTDRTCTTFTKADTSAFHVMTVRNPGTVRYRSPSPEVEEPAPLPAPVLEDRARSKRKVSEEVEADPTWAEAGPSYQQAGPSWAEAGPSGPGDGPSGWDLGPSEFPPSWRPRGVRSHPHMYNFFNQAPFFSDAHRNAPSAAPSKEVICLSDSDDE